MAPQAPGPGGAQLPPPPDFRLRQFRRPENAKSKEIPNSLKHILLRGWRKPSVRPSKKCEVSGAQAQPSCSSCGRPCLSAGRTALCPGLTQSSSPGLWWAATTSPGTVRRSWWAPMVCQCARTAFAFQPCIWNRASKPWGPRGPAVPRQTSYPWGLVVATLPSREFIHKGVSSKGA